MRIIQQKWTMSLIVYALLFMVLFLLVSRVVYAGVVINTTRIIYPAKEREVTVKLTNESDGPLLVQAWVDLGEQNAIPDQIKVPFAMTPPLFRMESKKGQALRLIYTKEPMPQDKESVFWLNVLSIPPEANVSADINVLQFAIRTRIKLFFRPTGLTGNPNAAAEKVTWKLQKSEAGQISLQATNPTPYHVTLTKVALDTGTTIYSSSEKAMIAPGTVKDFQLENFKKSPEKLVQVNYDFINDFGANVSGISMLN